MDGFGIAPKGKGNCIANAKTPNYNSLSKNYSFTKLLAHGGNVGLPGKSIGNSEVGHLHMGAGRVVWQPFELINRKIKDKSFFKNNAFLKAIENCKKNNSTLHLLGMCSDEGVHASINHLFALIDLCKKEKFNDFVVHCILDGRDVPEKSAPKYIKQLEAKLKKIGSGRIASIAGRYYSMDRDKNWDRTKESYKMLTLGKGFSAKTALKAVQDAYERGDKTDYYVRPAVIGEPVVVKDNDSVIFFNFRTDRPRQLTHAFLDKTFSGFERQVVPKELFVTFTRYDDILKCDVAFEYETISHNVAEVISNAGLKQLRLAETEKYAHVTYFFNSQHNEPYHGEERIMIPSSKVPSYDLAPEMSAAGIRDVAVKVIPEKKFDFILLNFANCDLVGHSGVMPAVIKAVETVDSCLGDVVKSALANNYSVFITADHGNAEEMLYKNGEAKPSHTTNKVPFILVSNSKSLAKKKLRSGQLLDIAPTILKFFGLKKPKEMTGKPLY